MHDPQGAHCLNDQEVEFISVRATAGPGDRFQPVDSIALGILLDKRFVARLLDPLRDFIERIVPGDVCPVRSAGPAYLRFQQPAIVKDILLERSTLGTQRPAVSWMVGIAFDVDHLRRNVLRPVPDRVDDRPATHGAIRTRRPRFISAGDFEYSELCVSGLEVEPENSGCRSAYRSEFQKVSAGSLHGTPLV